MFTLIEVFCSTAPVCSATFMNRLLNSSSSTGSGRPLPAATRVASALGAAQDHVVERGDLGGPAGFDHGGRVGLADQRRARDAIAGQQRGAIEHRRACVLAAGEHRDRVDRSAAPPSRARRASLRAPLAGSDRLDGDRLDHQRPLRRGEAEARAMRRGEVLDDLLRSSRSGTISAASVPA